VVVKSPLLRDAFSPVTVACSPLSRRHAASLSRPELLAAIIGRALVLDRPAREQRRMSRRALGSPTDYRLPRALAACGDCVHPKAPEGVTMPLSFMAEQCAAEQQAAERRAIPGA
jgi:hypothetical protein